MVYNSKTAGHGGKQNETGGGGEGTSGTYMDTLVTFCLIVVKVILELFGTLVSKWPTTRKRPAVE